MGGFSVYVIIWTFLSLSVQYSVVGACTSSENCSPGGWCDTVSGTCTKCFIARPCNEDECIRVCSALTTKSTTRAVTDEPPPTSGPDSWSEGLLLLLCVLVAACLLVLATALTIYVIYRCLRRERGADNRDAEKPFLRQTSVSTRASESSTSSDRDVTCCMTSRGSRDVDKPRGNGVTINNVMTVSANGGNGIGQRTADTEGQRTSFYLQHEPPAIQQYGKTVKA